LNKWTEKSWKGSFQIRQKLKLQNLIFKQGLISNHTLTQRFIKHLPLEKSEIVPIGEVEVDNLAHIVGCRVESLPMTYLGLPWGVSYKATCIWNGVIEKVERQLAG